MKDTILKAVNFDDVEPERNYLINYENDWDVCYVQSVNDRLTVLWGDKWISIFKLKKIYELPKT